MSGMFSFFFDGWRRWIQFFLGHRTQGDVVEVCMYVLVWVFLLCVVMLDGGFVEWQGH
jgi:hypothetical protein